MASQGFVDLSGRTVAKPGDLDVLAVPTGSFGGFHQISTLGFLGSLLQRLHLYG